MMRKISNLCTYFRGRLDIPTAMEMSITDIHALTYIMYMENNTEEGKNAKQGEVLEDALVHGEV